MDEIQLLWRVETLRDEDGIYGTEDGDPALYYGRIIDVIMTSLEGALEVAQKKLEGSAIKVTISREKMSDRYREMYYGPKIDTDTTDIL